MIMLSELLRFSITDKQKNKSVLTDLAVELREEENYPLVIKLFFSSGNKLNEIGWERVENLDLKHRLIEVDDLENCQECPSQIDTKEVNLRRDVLDALIIDLQNRRTTRANDLMLEVENRQLRLKGADLSFTALLRRITRNTFNRINKDSICDWKYVEFLRGDPCAVENGKGYNRRISRLPAGEIAQISYFLPYLHTAELLTLLPDSKAADVLEALTIEKQLQVIEEFDEKEAVELLAAMSPDLAADLMRRLKLPVMKHYLERLPKIQGERIIELLRYPEDSIGGVMVNDIIMVPAGWSIFETRQQLSTKLKGPDLVSILFVVDNEKDLKLRGTILLRQLFTEDEDKLLEEIMDPFVETLNPQDPARPAAFRIIGSQLDAMPVTDSNGKLLGAMTIDAAVNQIAPEASEFQTMRIFS